MSRVAVIDIGKTNAKLALVDTASMAELAVLSRPNRVLPGPPWPHFDVDGHWDFLLDGLAAVHRAHGVDAISVTTHGACAALLDAGCALAAPILDYEHPGPDALAEAYDAIRPDFAETGSPRLPLGLNLGAQLHWMLATDPGLLARTARVVTYPQYWGFRLTGVAACDVSSLGCHTDLWAPEARGFSSLVARLGLEGRMAPARAASDVLGPVLPEVARRTGLAPGTPVLNGIHDSNASLLPHLMARQPPFSVVSTGTWVVAMCVGGRPVALDPARDTLINVSAFGDPIPSARFMGGREFETVAGRAPPPPTQADIAAVLAGGVMLLPAVVPGSGPFQGRAARWLGGEPPADSGARTAAASFHAALVTATCLDLAGHDGPIVVEGPFARNPAFCAMLAAATGAAVVPSADATGTSHGAALLALPPGARLAAPPAPAPVAPDPAMVAHAAAWREATG
jgi:sugar (pentulose or hexulose) kinase